MEEKKSVKKIPELMTETYQCHKTGEKLQAQRVYGVNLSDYSVKEIELNDLYREKMKSPKEIRTVHELFIAIDFDELIPFLNLMKKENEKVSYLKFPEILIFKDAFDFLRDQTPEASLNKKLNFEVTETGLHVCLEALSLRNWNEFMALKIDKKDLERFTIAEIVADLLFELFKFSHNSNSVYGALIFVPGFSSITDDKGWIKTYVEGDLMLKYPRPLIKYLFKPLFGRFLRWYFQRIGNLVSFQRKTFLTQTQIQILPENLLDEIKTSRPNRFDSIIHLRSHIHQSKAVEYMMHLLSTFDTPEIERSKDKYLFLEYSDKKHLEIVDFLKEKFNTKLIYCFQSGHGDIRLSIWAKNN